MTNDAIVLGYKIAELIWDVKTMDDLSYLTKVTDDLIKVKKDQLEILQLTTQKE